jgi:hypothetical protein
VATKAESVPTDISERCHVRRDMRCDDSQFKEWRIAHDRGSLETATELMTTQPCTLLYEQLVGFRLASTQSQDAQQETAGYGLHAKGNGTDGWNENAHGLSVIECAEAAGHPCIDLPGDRAQSTRD